MFRLESVSPLVVAWAVSLGLGGLLLMLFLSGDPSEDLPPQVNDPAVPAPPVQPVQPVQRPSGPEVAGPVGSEPGQPVAGPSQSAAAVAKSDAAGVEQEPDGKNSPAAPPPEPQAQPAQPARTASAVAAKPNRPQQPAAPQVKPAPDSKPKPKPKPRPAVEIEAALKLPIVRYVHQKPVAVSVVIREISQLGGIDVRLDKGLKGDVRLDGTVQLDLGKTTVGGILDATLKMVGLTRRVRDGYVLIVLPANGADPRGTR